MKMVTLKVAYYDFDEVRKTGRGKAIYGEGEWKAMRVK